MADDRERAVRVKGTGFKVQGFKGLIASLFKGLRFNALLFKGLRFNALLFKGLRFKGLRFNASLFKGLKVESP